MAVTWRKWSWKNWIHWGLRQFKVVGKINGRALSLLFAVAEVHILQFLLQAIVISAFSANPLFSLQTLFSQIFYQSQGAVGKLFHGVDTYCPYFSGMPIYQRVFGKTYWRHFVAECPNGNGYSPDHTPYAFLFSLSGSMAPATAGRCTIAAEWGYPVMICNWTVMLFTVISVKQLNNKAFHFHQCNKYWHNLLLDEFADFSFITL